MLATPILSLFELDTLVQKMSEEQILRDDDLMDLMEFLEPHQQSVVRTAATFVLVDAPITWKQVEQFDIENTVSRNCKDKEAVRMVQLKCARIELEELKSQELRESFEEDVTIVSAPKERKKAYEFITTFSSDEEDVTSSEDSLEETTMCWSTVDEFHPPVTSTPLPMPDSEDVTSTTSSEIQEEKFQRKIKQAYVFQTTFSSSDEDSEDLEEELTISSSFHPIFHSTPIKSKVYQFQTTFDDDL